MALGNFTSFRAKHVEGIKFGNVAWTVANWASAVLALDTTFTTNNATALINLVGSADTSNPTKSYAFAKDFSTAGNERSSSEESLLGADTSGSQNTELSYGNNSKIDVEFTCVYRNPQVTAIFNDSTKCCLIQLDNEEGTTTGVLNLAFNNIVMTHVGSLTRNSDGLMEQKVKFSIRGGFASTVVSVSQVTPSETWVRYNIGPDYAEEIRTA
jgi:hypothetical protein